jgi:hypothetical protein
VMLVVSLAAAKVKNGVSLRDYGIATGEVRNAEVSAVSTVAGFVCEFSKA